MNYDGELRTLQLRLLDVLTEIDRVCREQNLTYYLLAGTMLGAVRHHGFIPWDDDIDIGMPRGDYDRFFEIAHQCLPNYLELKNYTSHPDYIWWFMKVEDKRTTLIEKKWLKYKGGIYIDIFPLDGEPENQLKRKLHFGMIEYRMKIRYFMYRDPFKHGKGIGAWFVRFLQSVYTRERAQRRLEEQLKKYKYDLAGLVCDHDGGDLSLMPKSYVGSPVPVTFEGRQFMGVENPDAYLKSMYGNYMQLPPEGKRIQHGFYYFDLNIPYQDNPIDKEIWPNKFI